MEAASIPQPVSVPGMEKECERPEYGRRDRNGPPDARLLAAEGKRVQSRREHERETDDRTPSGSEDPAAGDPGKKPPRSRARLIGRILVIAGAVLLAGALALFGYNRWDDWRAGNALSDVQNALIEAEKDGSGIRQIPDEMATINIDGYDYIGMLSVPRFELELPVMSEWSYEGMKIAPGRYSGSVWTNDMVICGHNYTTHFGPLGSLEPGNQITFTDVLGDVFNYEVAELEVLQPTAIEEMITGDWDLTLFTCTLGGQTRMTVRCDLVSEELVID